jgi:uncharacterized protein YdiU (UPF0061 family)
MFKFQNTYATLPSAFHKPATPTSAVKPNLLIFNHQLATELGLEYKNFSDLELAAVFSGLTLPSGSSPIASVYAGHQFGNFVPQLGDGRAILLGEIISPAGHRFDIQLKGSGITPYSRKGDGRSSLGPVIREYIVSEAMHALGVPSTRALAAVTTGDRVFRDHVDLPGGVLTRVARGHLRIGTFEYFAAKADLSNLKILADYAIDRFYPEIKNDDKLYLSFFNQIAKRQAKLIAKWMSFGFIHGVMNTDNMSIVGETIDFGPCAFMDIFKFDQVYSFIDRRGRYAYNQQIEIAKWNLMRLAECLIPLIDQNSETATKLLQDEIALFPALFESEWLKQMRFKMGLMTVEKEDTTLITNYLQYLETKKLDFTNSFRQLPLMIERESPHFIIDEWKVRLKRQPQTMVEVTNLMNQVNPVYIPRNHLIEKAISNAIDGNLELFLKLNKILANPYQDQDGDDQFKFPPKTEEIVKNTFCGT